MQVRRLERRRLGFAVLGSVPALGAVIATFHGHPLIQLGLWSALAVVGFGFALEAHEQLNLRRALGLEVDHLQRVGLYEVKVRLNPVRPLHVRQLTAVLECVEIVITTDGETSFESRRKLFSRTEHLFEGRARLGHGERLDRRCSFQLPQSLERSRLAAGDRARLHSRLTIRVLVGGRFLEFEEDAELELPSSDQVTLSQM